MLFVLWFSEITSDSKLINTANIYEIFERFAVSKTQRNQQLFHWIAFNVFNVLVLAWNLIPFQNWLLSTWQNLPFTKLLSAVKSYAWFVLREREIELRFILKCRPVRNLSITSKAYIKNQLCKIGCTDKNTRRGKGKTARFVKERLERWERYERWGHEGNQGHDLGTIWPDHWAR